MLKAYSSRCEQEWSDFVHRLKSLIHLSSQYKRINTDHINSSLTNTKQNNNENHDEYLRKGDNSYELLTIENIKHEQIDKSLQDIQLYHIKTNENMLEKAYKRVDSRRDICFH